MDIGLVIIIVILIYLGYRLYNLTQPSEYGEVKLHEGQFTSTKKIPNMFKDDIAEVIPGLYIGNFIAASNSDLLHQLGITHVLNCAGELNPKGAEGRTYMKLDLKDLPTDDIYQYFPQTSIFIDQALNGPIDFKFHRKGKVLVHCAMGISRSASVVIAYLIDNKYKTYADALQMLRDVRPIVRPNPGYVEQLIRYQNKPLVSMTNS